ncbi:MAG: transglycosylase SLT domain-containing protein [Gammaproteobacteria bacterium]|nr:transglycosylase SLT domain-containing protein [Gammaproteobacteria bacterium]
MSPTAKTIIHSGNTWQSGLLAVLCFIVIAPTVQAGTDLKSQRQQYRQAQDALKKGQISRYKHLRKNLEGYVLSGYLDYAYLKKRIAITPNRLILQTIEENLDAPTSQWLRRKWLNELVRRRDWDGFMEAYQDIPRRTGLKCHYLRQQQKRGRPWEQLDTPLRELWLTGRSQPATCNTLFKTWHKAGFLKRDLVWARVRKAMERGQLGLAQQISKSFLEKQDRTWVTRWVAMHRKPQTQLKHIKFKMKRPVARMVVKHGVKRLGKRDPESAMQVWNHLTKKYDFNQTDHDEIYRKLGLLAAWRHMPIAVAWLAQVPAAPDDDELRHWRMRAALRGGHWSIADRFLIAATAEEKKENTWRYFRARVLEKSGHQDQANFIYKRLARERDYYGFMAADRIGGDYQMRHRDIQASESEIEQLSIRSGMRMAKELFSLGQLAQARRQWAWVTKDLNKRELQIAALLAHQWGWHDRAILTVNKSGHRDDLNLRFPVLYQDLVEQNAKISRIDPGWVFGVVRQESAFITDARSHAGALGLMQLMPSTGRLVGRRIKLKIRNRYSILNVKNNIRLGTSYLRTVLDTHKGNQVLATAAYNAGPHRVRRWLPKHTLDADLWVESIPFDETRRYVKNVLGFATIYNQRLDYPRLRLGERMLPIDPLTRSN